MFLKLMLFSLLIPLVWGQEDSMKVLGGFDPVADVISSEYEAGPFLIYNCKKKIWACVLEEYYQSCEKSRIESIELGEFTLPCAPVGEFPTKKSCFQRQLFMVSQNYGTRFCIKEELRTREIKY